MIIPELTEEQQNSIINKWNENPANPPTLKELTNLLFPGKLGRDPEGMAVKKFLSTRNLKAVGAGAEPKKSSLVELTEEHRMYIISNAKNNTPVEMARTLFNNPSISNLHSETRAIANFIKEQSTKVLNVSMGIINDVPMDNYSPPKTLDKTLKKVNEYLNYFNGSFSELNPQQKKNIEKLLDYMSTYKFLRTMNSMDSEMDRKTCEDAFIRYTYDKPDLTQEEIDQYVELCNHIVQGFKIQRRSELLQKQQEEVAGNDPETRKYSMGLVEAIGKASTEYHQCIDRQKKLLESLTEKRSERLSSQIKDNASILNLVQLWKEEESRLEMLKIAELEQQGIADEVERISTIEEIKMRILGLDRDRILKG
jgi:hypothetical protein